MKFAGGGYNYVREAIKNLIINKMLIYKISLENLSSSFHDKLILSQHKDKKSVIIDSAGFTKDLQLNQNYENMVFIENDESVYTQNESECEFCSLKIVIYPISQ